MSWLVLFLLVVGALTSVGTLRAAACRGLRKATS